MPLAISERSGGASFYLFYPVCTCMYCKYVCVYMYVYICMYFQDPTFLQSSTLYLLYKISTYSNLYSPNHLLFSRLSCLPLSHANAPKTTPRPQPVSSHPSNLSSAALGNPHPHHLVDHRPVGPEPALAMTGQMH